MNYYLALILTSLLAITVNYSYIKKIAKGKINKSGSAIAHIGVGLIIVGIVISTSKSIEISKNTSGSNIPSISSDFDNNTNILFKHDTIRIEYFVSYEDKEVNGVNLYFSVNYFEALRKE